MKAPIKPFIVVRGHLPAKERPHVEPVVVVDKTKADQKRRDKRLKALASAAFRNWRPGT